jgi:hypothetical protein
MCQLPEPQKTERLVELGTISDRANDLSDLAFQACLDSDRELINDLKKKYIEEILDRLVPKKAGLAYLEVDGRVENTLLGFAVRDWVSLDATLTLQGNSPCKPQTVTIVSNKVVNPEATGNAVDAQANSSESSTIALVVPSASVSSLQSCTYSMGSSVPLTVSYRDDVVSGNFNGKVSLAPLATDDGRMLALPTDAVFTAKVAGATLTMTLDKTCPHNTLVADANGQGTLKAAMLVDSPSSLLAGDLAIGRVMYFEFPVTVAQDWSSVRVQMAQGQSAAAYTPFDPVLLMAGTAHQTTVAIGGDVCADADNNGIRDGADEVIRAIDITSGCNAR